MGDEGAEIPPALAALAVQAEHRPQIGRDDPFHRHSGAGFGLVAIHLQHALGIQHVAAPREHRVEHPALGFEVIVQQGGIDIGELGDLAHRHAIDAVAREQFLGRIENALAGGHASLRPLGRFIVHQRPAKRATAFTSRALPLSTPRNRGHSLHNRTPQGTITVVVVVAKLT